MKLGRNDLCWCGSGKKFKNCHLNRQEQEMIKPWEAEQSLRKAFGAKYCSVPENMKTECKGKIVRAHSVSKSMNLKKIEKEGHVYAIIPSVEKLIKNSGVFQPVLYGINQASTFTGFCEYHDKMIFSPLEDEEFVGSKEQCFLLAFRTIAREYYTKKSSANLTDFIRKADSGRSPLEQMSIQSFASAHSLGVDAGLKDITIYKNKMDMILNAKDFKEINAFVINFSKTPSIFCSAGVFPEYDFEGNKLQDLSDLKITPDLLIFSTIATKNGGSAVFTWLNDSDNKGNCERCINSLKKIDPDNITNSLIRFYFEFCENIFMEPIWWESLEKMKKDCLVNRLSNASSVLKERKADCLCNDNLMMDDWGFSGTQEIK